SRASRRPGFWKPWERRMRETESRSSILAPDGGAAPELETEAKKNAEMKRLEETSEAKVPWQKWGPYLSERQWGTVREDTALKETPGTTSLTIRRVPALIVGAKTVWPGFATTSNCFVSRWRSGMAMTP